jgi:hypothetical protein
MKWMVIVFGLVIGFFLTQYLAVKILESCVANFDVLLATDITWQINKAALIAVLYLVFLFVLIKFVNIIYNND